MNYKWTGKTKLCNIVTYLSRELDVPEAALLLRFKWPCKKTGKVEMVTDVEVNKGEVDLGDLRAVWRAE